LRFGASGINKMEDKKEENKPVQEQDNKPTELEECKSKCEEYLNGWKRAKADYINYKKEEFDRAQELVRYARENFLESLLPMLDNLRLVQKQMPAELQEDANVKGLLMVKVQLEDFLKSQGVEAIDSLDKVFDPAVHEVIQAVEAEGKESGTIVEEIEKGYTINGRLLRPAKVKVSK
jgi:molecular chaperone GrpE